MEMSQPLISIGLNPKLNTSLYLGKKTSPLRMFNCFNCVIVGIRLRDMLGPFLAHLDDRNLGGNAITLVFQIPCE